MEPFASGAGSGLPASSYPPSHPPSDFRYTFLRPPTRNFAQEPRMKCFFWSTGGAWGV